MKLIKPYTEIIEQAPGLDGLYKHIELIGRVSYKSEDKITEDSAKEFVDRMTKLGHGAVLEHGTVYLRIPIKGETSYRIDSYKDNPYTRTKIARDLRCYYISTNYRVLVEHNWLDDLQYLCESTEFHEKRISVRFVADAGVMREFFRHRTFSLMQESTRYCNYSKDKFGNELTFIIPPWLELQEGTYTYDFPNGFTYNGYKLEGKSEFNAFLIALARSEDTYMHLLKDQNWKAQEARGVLPLAIKSEGIMTGFVSDWKHFFELRTASSAHPQAQELAIPLQEEFNKLGLLGL